MKAAESGNKEAARVLLHHGARWDLDADDDDSEDHMLHYMLTYVLPWGKV